MIAKLFSAKTGDTITGSDDAGAYVAQLKTINIPQSTPDDQVKALTTEIGNSARYDLASEFTNSLKKRFPVTIHHDVVDRLFWPSLSSLSVSEAAQAHSVDSIAERIGRPTAPGEVITDSGWNCTAAIGSVLCSIAMMTPSAVSAATDSSAGNTLLRA